MAALTDNLVAYWKLDETAGGTADDANSALSTYDGTIGANVVLNQSSKTGFGTSFLFNRSSGNSYISLPDVAGLQVYDQHYSMSVWVYPTEFTSSQRGIIGGETGSLVIFLADINGQVGAASNDVSGITYSGINLTLNAWNHICITFDSTATTNNFTYYINGSTATVSWNNNFSSGASSNVIGGLSTVNNPFVGKIDEVGFWKSKVLSSAEAAQLYNSGDGLPYPFATYGGVLYGYNGSIWETRPLAVQNGGMVVRPVYFWDGTSWKLVQSF